MQSQALPVPSRMLDLKKKDLLVQCFTGTRDAQSGLIPPTETKGFPNNCRPSNEGPRRKCINNHVCYALLKIQKDFKFK